MPILDWGLDAVLIATTVPSWGVPNEEPYSFIPFIAKATELRIPVYLIRGLLVSAQRPEWLKERNLTSLYGPEVDSIRAGAMPLEKPDTSETLDVVAKMIEVYSTRPEYQEGIDAVCAAFSRPEFVEQVRRIREGKNPSQ